MRIQSTSPYTPRPPIVDADSRIVSFDGHSFSFEFLDDFLGDIDRIPGADLCKKWLKQEREAGRIPAITPNDTLEGCHAPR